jgi:hypothetical protein
VVATSAVYPLAVTFTLSPPSMGRCRGSAWPGNGGVCRWGPFDPGEIHPPRRLAHGSGRRQSRRSAECPGALGHGGRPSSCCRLLPPLGRTRGRTVDAASSAKSVRARTWWPAELPPPSRASARPDTGKHGRRRLASSASSVSARPWRLADLPSSPGGAALSAIRGRAAGGAQPWRPAKLPPSPASAWPVSRTRGCLLLVGPSAARPTASSSSAGLDSWIHAQSRSMTLSEHRKLEEIHVVHVRPKAMCVHSQRSRLGTSSEHSGAG